MRRRPGIRTARNLYTKHRQPPISKSSRKVKLIVITPARHFLHNGHFNPDLLPGRTAPIPEEPMDQTKRVLIVEDDADIANVLMLHLRDEHYEVVHSADGTEGLRLLEQGGWDALILDLMLPGVDGLEICRRARAMTRYTPIIITSARSSEVHRILGLELGADDYLAKPFSVLELVARVKALLRRVEAMAKDLRLEGGTLMLGGFSIDPVTREAQVDGRRIELTPREFDLLYHFARHPGKVFSRMELLNAVWGYQHEGYEHTVNTHINRLRTKIEVDPAQPVRILTVWGRGYKFDPLSLSLSPSPSAPGGAAPRDSGQGGAS